MSQVSEVSVPLSARKNVFATRMARGAGFVSAVGLGLIVNKLPKEKLVTAMAVLLAAEVATASLNAFDDEGVSEAMEADNFGTHPEKLEAAGLGLGIGFAAVAVAVMITKLLKKGEGDEQSG